MRIERGLDRIIVVVLTYLVTTYAAWILLRTWLFQFMYWNYLVAVVVVLSATGWLAFRVLGARNRESLGWRILAAASLALAMFSFVEVISGFFYGAEFLLFAVGAFFSSVVILRLSRYSPSR